jgi:hypothetical protein
VKKIGHELIIIEARWWYLGLIFLFSLLWYMLEIFHNKMLIQKSYQKRQGNVRTWNTGRGVLHGLDLESMSIFWRQ